MKCLKELAIPLIWLYNYCMLDMKDMKKELVIELNMIGEWFSRGERGIDNWEDSVNVEKIRKVWNSREDEDELDEGGLNAIEERILVGDGGFIWDDDENYKNSRRGIEGCMGRVDELLEGKSIMIECEEEVFCIGSNNSKEINKVEIDFMKGKIELLER